MKRFRKPPEKREDAEVASLGSSSFNFKFPIRCQTTEGVTKRLWWYSRGYWIWWLGCWCFMRKLHLAEIWRWAGGESARRLSAKSQKEFGVQSERQRKHHIRSPPGGTCLNRLLRFKRFPSQTSSCHSQSSSTFTESDIRHTAAPLIDFSSLCFHAFIFSALISHYVNIFWGEWVAFGICKAPVRVQFCRPHHSLEHL